MTRKSISDKKYGHALGINVWNNNVWNKSKIKIIKGYHVLYLKCGVLFLVDVFEKFTKNRLRNSGLCSSNYLSAPGLSWGAMLKVTKVDLDFITDPNMFIFFKKGTRGSYYISNRYRKTNNKYLKFHDSKQESINII